MLGSSSELLLPGQQSPVRQLHPPVQWSSSIQDNSSLVSQLPVSDPSWQSCGLQVRSVHIIHRGDGPHGCGQHCPGRLQCLLPHPLDTSHFGHILLSWIKISVNSWISTVSGTRRTNWRVCGWRQGVDQEGEETERETESVSEKQNRSYNWIKFVRNVLVLHQA